MPFRVDRWFLLLGPLFNNTSQSLQELRLERLAGPSLSMIWLALDVKTHVGTRLFGGRGNTLDTTLLGFARS